MFLPDPLSPSGPLINDPYTSGWHQRIVELEKQRSDLLEKFVDYMYSQLEAWLQFQSLEKISYLARLADFWGDGVGVDIFSLNYDLCIETALSRIAKRAFVNGFTEEGWRPAILWDENAPIRLFKLHGSLDWAEDEAYGVCSFQFPRHKDAEDIEGSTRPLLIFGTNHKLSALEPFLSLAHHFSQCILKTTALAIVGYSFGDTYINDIIKQGLRTNSRLKIIVVSPNPAEQVKKFPLLDHPRVTTIPSGAENALNKSLLLNEVREVLKDALNEEPFGAANGEIT